MTTLIVYTTKNGTTAKCANMLAEKLDNVEVVNLQENSADLAGYDTVIIGSGIRFGKIPKRMHDFMIENKAALLNKHIALFICCGFQNQAEQHFNANFPVELLNHAITKQCFGGELNTARLHGFDRFIVSIVMKSAAAKNNPVPGLLLENIDELAQCVQ
ncbi:MAG: flavodoxin domain-containing protein [Bacillus sp. (in: firmicutes)]